MSIFRKLFAGLFEKERRPDWKSLNEINHESQGTEDEWPKEEDALTPDVPRTPNDKVES